MIHTMKLLKKWTEFVKNTASWAIGLEPCVGGRDGFKAGALQNALMQTDEEYVAIFNSDFTPTEDFLDETIPYLTENLLLGLVQCRWGYINREYSFLSRTFAIGMDGHFLIEQPGRYASNCFLNFNGSGGVLRKTAIVEAGGWMPDTLAEDLDLSYRMQLKGFKILYLRDLSVLGEIPPTIAAFKRQQARWARGSLQVAKKLLPALIKSRNLTFKQKIEGFIHLTYYFVHPLMLASFILIVVATFLELKTTGLPISEIIIDVHGATITEYVGSFIAGFLKFIMSLSLSWLIFYVCILIGAVASWLLYITTLRNQGLSVKDNLKYLIALGFIGYGISISNSLEVAKALFLRNVGEFKRTPKYAVKKESDEWKNKKYQVPLQKTMLFELAMGVLGVASICFAVITLNYGMVPLLVLFTICYINMVVLTKLHSKKEEL